MTVGPSKRATFTTPPIDGKNKFPLARPKRGAYVLQLAPGMTGDIQQAGQTVTVADLLAGTAQRRRAGALREVTIAPGDRAQADLRRRRDLRVEIRWVDPPETIARPRLEDPDAATHGDRRDDRARPVRHAADLACGRRSRRTTLALTPAQLVKIEAPIEQEKVASRQRPRRRRRRRRRTKEGQTKRAKEKAGKIGRNDAKPKDTVIPKGDEDILREKVAKTGMLRHRSAGRRRAGSGLSKLFAQSNDVEQAMAGHGGREDASSATARAA